MKSANYVMGLDLGTSSIGIGAWSLSTLGEPDDILFHHVYLFKEPVASTTSGLVSKKAGRRGFRQARKQRDRRSGRLQHLNALCKTHLNSNDLNQFPLRDAQMLTDCKRFESLALRAYAVTQPISLNELSAVLFHLSKGRGYSSGFKPLSKKTEEKLQTATNFDDKIKLFTGEVQPGHQRLAHIMQLRNTSTVGQYMLDRATRGLPSILKAGNDRAYIPDSCEPIADEIEQIVDKNGVLVAQNFHNLYALRDELKIEFDLIWHKQAEFHPTILTDELRNKIEAVLFYQRPLKSIQAMIGGCLVEPNLPRASRAHPAFQTFRIEKSLADLRWGYGRNAKPLTHQERDIIRQALHDPAQLDSSGELTFDRIYKLLEPVHQQSHAQIDVELDLFGNPTGKPKSSELPKNLNLEKGGRDGLKGNITNKRWQWLGLYEAWEKLATPQPNDPPHMNRQTWVINFLSDLGSVELLYPDNWTEQFYLRDIPAKNGKPARIGKQLPMFTDPLFLDFINQLRKHEKFDRLSAMKFDSGRTSYSIKALNKINEWMREAVDFGHATHIDEHEAIEQLYRQSQINEKTVLELLENPVKTGNGVVDVALMQVKKVVNHYIAQHGKPTRIVVEMAREMSEGITRRNEMQSQQNKNKGVNKKATDDMHQHHIPYSKTNVLRYRLAQDQGYDCPYCGKKLGVRDIYDGGSTQIEHIIPQAITQVGRKYSEIVLAHTHCNQKKGRRVPMEAFAFNTTPIEQMAQRLRSIKQERKALLLEIPETPENSVSDDMLNEFCARQFHETAWITKITATWLRSLGINVECTRGQMTAQLRAQWHLESILPEVRIAEGLPAYSTVDTTGEVKETIIPPEAMFDKDGNKTLLWRYWNKEHLTHDEFEELRNTGLYQFDKRCDHRHHLIDALVTALCSRSMVKRMADEYKKRSEQEAQKQPEHQRRIRFGRIATPVERVREKVLNAVKEQKVTHRPDRKVSGAWFQDTAYGLYTDPTDARLQYLVNRCAVRALIGKDDAVTTANIESVIGPEIKATLKASYRAFYQAHWGNDSPKNKEEYSKACETLWLTPPLHQRTQRPIIKVRQKYKPFEAGKHVIIRHTDQSGVVREKVLISDENAFIAWNPESPVNGYRVVSNYQARGVSDVPKHWMRVYKGDTVLAKNGLKYCVNILTEAGGRVETMRLVCTTVKTKQSEGHQDFYLEPPKRKGSMSLWDIVEIIRDPFYGRPASSTD